MSKIYTAIGVLVFGSVLTAQESTRTAPPLFVDAVQKGLQTKQTIRVPRSPDTPIPGQQLRRLGLVSLIVPDPKLGEVIRVGIPIGALTVRMADGLSNARRERAERKTDERVRRDLDAFLTQQPKK